MNRLAIALALVVLAASVALAGSAGALPPNGPSPNVVVSQVYGGGGNASAPFNEDFVELFNRGAAAQSVAGWSIQYASATGTGNLGANSAQLTALPAVSIPAGGYLLVGEATGATGGALPMPDATGGINLSATAGKVALATGTDSLGCNGGSTPCTDAQKTRIVDLVGYGTGSSGANFFEGSAAAPTISNTTADARAADGCTDTDDNAAHFKAGPPNPRNSSTALAACGSVTPTPPSVAGAASPASVDSGAQTLLTGHVIPGANPPSSGLAVSGDLTPIGGPATQAFFDDGTHGDSTAGDGIFSFLATVPAATAPGSKSLPLAVSDAEGRSGTGSIALTVTTPATSAAIHDIQGAAQISPLLGQRVATSGVVTAVRSNGFNLQDPSPDTDPATSEGIFVFTSGAPAVAVGDAAAVTGVVAEFRPGGSSGVSNLTSTELDSPSVTVTSPGNALPPAVLIGPGGRVPPTETIEDDATGDVETSGVFDPASDGIDFWESLEGMRVEIDDPVPVGPTNAFGETPVVSAAAASVRTPRGGVVVRPNDFNPERVVLDDGIVSLPTVNVGDHYSGPLVGVLDYDFGNFFLEATQPVTASNDGVTPETTDPAGPDQLAIATFNVENLAPSDPPAKFDRLANIVVHNLAAPDVVAVEEVQDNSGATDNGAVAADVTVGDLIAAIKAAGGPTYAYRQINPVNDQDGGQPGGNIRVVFLFRTDRGLSFVDAPGGTSTAPDSITSSGDLAFSPGRVDPANPAWDASRKPLAGEFTFHGRKLFLIANHWVAKLPDDPLLGHVQPPQQQSEPQRVLQATAVRDFTRSILAGSPRANVVVLGDLNDFQFSDSLTTLDGAPLRDLINTLPEGERYTYDYEGNSEALDHILFSDALFAGGFAYDVVHVNSEFADQSSDHDPQVARLSLPCRSGTLNAPLVVAAGEAVCLGPNAHQNGPVTVKAGGSLDLEGATVVGPIRSTGAAGFRACGASIGGPLSVSGSTGLVLVGGDDATGVCAGNEIDGTVDLTNNTAGVELNGTTIDGPLTISGTTGSLPPPDTGPVHASGNTVSGPVRIRP